MICCGRCENYVKSFDHDRHRKCRATGQRHWPGDSAYECPHIILSERLWERRNALR